MNLETNVKILIGVGPKMMAKLNRLGIETVSDLIFYYPRTYKDFTKIIPISAICHSRSSRESSMDPRRSLPRTPIRGGDDTSGAVTIKGKIIGIHNKKTSRRRFTVTEAIVEDSTGSINVVWFNQPFLAKIFTVGREVILNGKIEYNFYSREVVLESPERALKPMILPVYGETAGITSKYISKLVESIKPQVENIKEFLPANLLCHSRPDRESSLDPRLRGDDKKGLLGIQDALINIHFPENREMLERARRRIAFDELFLIALRANLSKLELKKEVAPVISIKDDKKIAIATFLSSLPFKLTADQKKAVEDILEDMAKSVPMNRLLNGDVGSGKTVVAAIAAYAAVKTGFRVAIMCPTEILAQQHFKTFCLLFKKQKVSVGLYTANCKDNFQFKIYNLKSISNDKMSKKAQAVSDTLNCDIVIGTQALIQEKVELSNLGLVVVDEQHRFGVAQRSALQNMGKVGKSRPHFLSMTATPIPRTLHLALFGDLDISVIRERPADRKEIKTRFVEPQNRDKAYEFIRAHIKAGRQAFVICPLIEEKDSSLGVIPAEAGIQKNYRMDSGSRAAGRNDNYLLFEQDRKSVKTEYEKLQKIFPEFKVAMLHGRLKSKEKDKIMADFCTNRTNILVSTSVVEVGIDIPNATIMMVEDAEHFGLAQIHQFRGRVGRAEHQSFCLLFSSTIGSNALRRMKCLETTSDGFRLAEMDLEQRGPGAVFGTEQSGLLDLKMASFSDTMLIEEASAAAKSITEKDPELVKNPLLKNRVSEYTQNKHLE